jgi:hypothetical protein
VKHRCVDHSELAGIARLPEDDPRRREIDECPRCTARLVQYREFMTGQVPPGGDAEGADAHLAGFMNDVFDRQLGGSGTTPDAPERTGFFDWLGRLFAPRPALAGAAVLIVAIAAVVIWQPWTSDPRVVRNDDSSRRQPATIVTLPNSVSGDGSVLLSWRPVAGADGYQIRIRTQELAELAVFGPNPDTSFTLNRDLLPAGAPETVWWEVVATRGGDEIARSLPSVLELP